MKKNSRKKRGEESKNGISDVNIVIFVFQDSCNKFVVPHDVMQFSEGRTCDFSW